MRRLNRGHALVVLSTAAGLLLLIWLVVSPRTSSSTEEDGRFTNDERPVRQPLQRDKRKVSDRTRADLLARAHVWRAPSVPVDRASFRGLELEEVTCHFTISDLGGTTPKFDCVLDSGEEIRIKYGNGPEVPTEAAATRLLRALGFGADEITLVRRLRCFGCPDEPFSTMRAIELTRTEPLYRHVVDFDTFEDFEWVALERKFDGRPVETETTDGWSFFELDLIDPTRGGAPRAHVDALRLMAVLLAHWDNKAENQRLVCASQEWPEGSPCPQPFLIMQDVGATFGPTKLDLTAWKQVPIWENRSTCTLSMRGLPFDGATFGETTISDAGRVFAAKLLSALSNEQLTELFTHARFGEKRGLFTPVFDVAEWVAAFTHKVQEISDGAPCPPHTG